MFEPTRSLPNFTFGQLFIRIGVNNDHDFLWAIVNTITITYITSSLVRPMIFRLTAPNWERPSSDYGSHIIMSISGIYLLISIHTLYHSQVLSLIQVHEITYFHHTLCLVKYTSASFSSLAPTVPSVPDLGHRRRALHLPPADQSGAPVRMSNNLRF